MDTPDTDLYFYRPMKDEGDVWREESRVSFNGIQAQPFISAAVSTCVYLDGVHVIPGSDCPHSSYNDITDEYEPGWTVLDNNRKEKV